ncbi:MAG: hypothetical protein FWD53_08930, partial [Phycisphaerales bacterium]|nr:hypothetical protein [Phycisphaerales bacterium]
HITRPLVIMPENLFVDETKHWLPYIMNPRTNEARTDYRDIHGGKFNCARPLSEAEDYNDPRMRSHDQFVASMKSIATTLESTGNTFKHLGMSLRLYACCVRSINNCLSLGIVRDRSFAKLTEPAHIPPKIGTWLGDPDLQLMLSYVRDELDNTTEMISLLENGGMRQMLVAEKAEDEDTFLLGPDLIQQLRKKCAIMRRHWLDAEAHMTMPHK